MCVFHGKYVDMTVKMFRDVVKVTDEWLDSNPMINVPGCEGQKVAGTISPSGLGSHGMHPLLTQWQRIPGPAAAHAVGVENAGQEGGV